jgi:plastocyanin
MTLPKKMAAVVPVTAAAFAVLMALVAIGCQSSPTLPGSPPPGAIIVSANQVKFEQAVVSAPASAPFTIWFENREAVPHNVNIIDEAGVSLAKGEIFNGPAARPLEVSALAPGNYRLICDVHPDMTAQLIAE